MITCKNCLQALYPYIDRELSEDDVVQVQAHLDDCPQCLHLYQFQASVRRLVRTRCQEQCAPAALKSRIQELFAREREKRAGRYQY